MTTIPIDRISAEAAREVDYKKLLLRILAVIPFVLGWLAAKVYVSVRFFFAAIRIGWTEGKKSFGRE